MRRALLLAVVPIAAAACGSRGSWTLSGTAEVTEVRMSSVIPGRLAVVAVDEGAEVKAGDVLFVLDTSDLAARRALAQAQVAQADAALSVARSQAAQADVQVDYADKEFKRAQSMAAAGAASDQKLSAAENAKNAAHAALDTAHQALDVAAATRRQAAAALGPIDVAIGEARVVSPIDGIVLSRLHEPGEVLAPGGVVVVLADLGKPWVRVFVPVTRLGDVKVGEPAMVRTDAGEKFDGTVTWISGQAEFTPKDVQTPEERVKQVFAVKVSVTDPAGRLKPGMPVDVLLGLK